MICEEEVQRDIKDVVTCKRACTYVCMLMCVCVYVCMYIYACVRVYNSSLEIVSP